MVQRDNKFKATCMKNSIITVKVIKPSPLHKHRINALSTKKGRVFIAQVVDVSIKTAVKGITLGQVIKVCVSKSGVVRPLTYDAGESADNQEGGIFPPVGVAYKLDDQTNKILKNFTTQANKSRANSRRVLKFYRKNG